MTRKEWTVWVLSVRVAGAWGDQTDAAPWGKSPGETDFSGPIGRAGGSQESQEGEEEMCRGPVREGDAVLHLDQRRAG